MMDANARMRKMHECRSFGLCMCCAAAQVVSPCSPVWESAPVREMICTRFVAQLDSSHWAALHACRQHVRFAIATLVPLDLPRFSIFSPPLCFFLLFFRK